MNHDPLIRSTQYRLSIWGDETLLYFVDRNLTVFIYEITNFSEGSIKQIQEIPLNKSYVNDTCFDINEIPRGSENLLMLFCRSKIYKKQSVVQEEIDFTNDFTYINVMITIYSYLTSPVLIYEAYKQDQILIDHPAGSRYMGLAIPYISNSVYLGNAMLNGKIKQSIFTYQSLAETMMYYEKKTYQFYENEYEIISPKHYIDFDSEFDNRRLIDIQYISYKYKSNLIFLFEGMIIMCPAPVDIFVSDYKDVINCDKDTGQLVNLTNGLSLYFNWEDSDYLYVSISYPPAVMEVDITDYNNRKGERFESIKYDFDIGAKQKLAFMAFPNYYFNVILSRDEKMINISTFSDYRITLYGKNQTLIQKYKETIFQCELVVFNEKVGLHVAFNITFVDQNYNKVLAIKNVAKNEISQDSPPLEILYNCGDNLFQYDSKSLFTGPSYELKIHKHSKSNEEGHQCQNGSCFFKLNTNKLKSIYRGNIEILKECNNNFLYPPQEKSGNFDKPNILVCVDLNNQAIRSYDLAQDESEFYGDMLLTNEIRYFQQAIVQIFWDANDRSMFYMYKTQSQWNLDDEDTWLSFFSIADNLIWQKNQRIKNKYFNDIWQIDNIQYNSDLNMGVLVSNSHLISDGNQTVVVFEISYDFLELIIITEMNLTHKVNGTCFSKVYKINCNVTIRQTFLINENFLLIWYTDQNISIYQIYDNWYNFPRLIKLRTFALNGDQFAEGMEVYEGKYLVVFYSDQFIEIYDIKTQIYVEFKFRLPFYEEFAGFKYYVNGFGQAFEPIKSYFRGYLSILMKRDFKTVQPLNQDNRRNLTDQIIQDTFIFVFCIKCESQHSSLVAALNQTEFFAKSNFRNSFLFGDHYRNNLVLLNDQKLFIYRTYFETQLEVNDLYKKELIEKCKNMKLFASTDKNNAKQYEQLILANLLIHAKSKLDKDDSGNQTVQIRIYSYNQGFTVSPIQSNLSSVYFTDEIGSQSKNQLHVQNFIQGYSPWYNFSCTFENENGIVQSCDGNIRDETQDKPFKFYIEFVTTNRQVTRVFNLGYFFLIFDQTNQWHLLRFADGNNDLNQMDGKALDQLLTGSEYEDFGCNLNGYFGLFKYRQSTKDPNRNIYIAIYQCKEKGLLLYMKAARIVTRIDADSKKISMNVTIFKNSYRIPIPIVDIERGSYQIVTQNNKTYMSMMIALSCEIPNSFSNIFYVLNMTLNLNNFSMILDEKHWLSSVILNKNTFKIQKLERIDNSELVIITDRNNGAYIYDFTTHKILHEFDVISDNYFYDQYSKIIGPIVVFTAIFNEPSSVHLLTNYGIYIYTFGVNLQDRSQIFPDFEQNLFVRQKSILRITFDEYSTDVARNKYGYTFLVKQNITQNSYDAYLGAVSFYAGSQSQILKLKKLGRNLDCNSLNYDDYLASDKEDQIAVSFVCNTQLYVVRFCMRPHLNLEFKNITNQAGVYDPSTQSFAKNQMSYNRFNITISVNNTFTIDEVGTQNITVMIFFQLDSFGSRDQLYIISFFVLALVSFFIIFVNQNLGSNRSQDKSKYDPKKQQSNKFLQSLFTSKLDYNTNSQYSKSNVNGLGSSFLSSDQATPDAKILRHLDSKQSDLTTDPYQLPKQTLLKRKTLQQRNKSAARIRINLQTNKITKSDKKHHQKTINRKKFQSQYQKRYISRSNSPIPVFNHPYNDEIQVEIIEDNFKRINQNELNIDQRESLSSSQYRQTASRTLGYQKRNKLN
eukprot:403365576